MQIDFSATELDMLESVLEAALRERLRQIHHADSREYRRRLENETDALIGIKAKVARHFSTS
jgi:hypothetical protein